MVVFVYITKFNQVYLIIKYIYIGVSIWVVSSHTHPQYNLIATSWLIKIVLKSNKNILRYINESLKINIVLVFDPINKQKHFI